METKTTFLKSSLVALFLMFIASATFADTYYLCSGGTFTLAPATPAPAGMVYRYDVNKDGATVSTDLTSPPTTFTGAGYYEIITKTVISPANPALCAPASVITNIVVLPTLSLAIGAPSNGSYCGSSTGHESVISLTGTAPSLPANVVGPPAIPYSTDLVLEYSYSVLKTGDALPVDGATIGTVNQTTGAYTLTTTTPGEYTITGTVKYKKIGSTTLLGTGCPASSGTQIVTVTTAPDAPVITVGP